MLKYIHKKGSSFFNYYYSFYYDTSPSITNRYESTDKMISMFFTRISRKRAIILENIAVTSERNIQKSPSPKLV